MTAFRAQLGSAQEIYAKEGRVDAWAAQRERDLADFSMDDLRLVDPDVALEVECRQSSCRVRLYSESALTQAMGPYPFACQASYATPEFGQDENGRSYADVYLLFGEDNQLDDEYRHNRDVTCPVYREKFRAKIAAFTVR